MTHFYFQPFADKFFCLIVATACVAQASCSAIFSKTNATRTGLAAKGRFAYGRNATKHLCVTLLKFFSTCFCRCCFDPFTQGSPFRVRLPLNCTLADTNSASKGCPHAGYRQSASPRTAASGARLKNSLPNAFPMRSVPAPYRSQAVSYPG